MSEEGQAEVLSLDAYASYTENIAAMLRAFSASVARGSTLTVRVKLGQAPVPTLALWPKDFASAATRVREPQAEARPRLSTLDARTKAITEAAARHGDVLARDGGRLSGAAKAWLSGAPVGLP